MGNHLAIPGLILAACTGGEEEVSRPAVPGPGAVDTFYWVADVHVAGDCTQSDFYRWYEASATLTRVGSASFDVAALALGGTYVTWISLAFTCSRDDPGFECRGTYGTYREYDDVVASGVWLADGQFVIAVGRERESDELDTGVQPCAELLQVRYAPFDS